MSRARLRHDTKNWKQGYRRRNSDGSELIVWHGETVDGELAAHVLKNWPDDFERIEAKAATAPEDKAMLPGDYEGK